jgi:hypothetical protein
VGSRCDQHAHPDEIDEVDSAEIEDDRRCLAPLEGLPQRLLEEWSGGEVELADGPNSEDGAVGVDPDDERELSNRTSSAGIDGLSLPLSSVLRLQCSRRGRSLIAAAQSNDRRMLRSARLKNPL